MPTTTVQPTALQLAPALLTALNIPVPATLEAALGVQGDARFIACFWTPAGDEFRIADGRTEYDGHWYAWQKYSDHRTVHTKLIPYHFGNSDYDAEHWLVFDRRQRCAYVGAPMEARRVLRAQYPAANTTAPVALTAHVLGEMLDAFRVQRETASGIEMAQRGAADAQGLIEARMAEQAVNLQRLVEELDALATQTLSNVS